MRRVIHLTVLCFLFLAVSVTSAQDPEGPYCTTDPEDDSGLPLCYSPDDNACYPGGEMENRCHTMFDWIVGWHVSRYNAGTLAREDIPAWVAGSMFPEGLVPLPLSNCVNLGPVGLPDDDILLNTNVFHENAQIYVAGTNCTEGKGIYFAIVYAVGSYDAGNFCNGYFHLPTPTDYTAAYPRLWRCSLR